MVRRPVNPPSDGWSLTFRHREWGLLFGHLFGKRGEHGAVVLARQVAGPRGPRLLAEQVLLASDGTDYVPGQHGYRALSPEFVRDAALAAADTGLAYLAFHNHGGLDRVEFSKVDMTSHERGYPALRQIVGGVVGAVVCTPHAAAGDLWLPDGTRVALAELVVPGANLLRLRPHPSAPASAEGIYDRQARLFGDAGQACFGRMRVAVVGQGGVGSLLTEMLARLGVGTLVLVDDDLIDETNLPRLVGAAPADIDTPKVQLGVRNARRASDTVQVTPVQRRIENPAVREQVADCDWIFLAADGHAARHWVTTIVEKHYVPGTQLGVKVPVDDEGEVGNIHVATRFLIPGDGCLWCNGLIDATKLAIDLHPESERKAAHYVADVPAASVMSFNALTASQAVSDFMLVVTNMRSDHEDRRDMLYFPRTREGVQSEHRRDPACDLCRDHGATSASQALG